MIVTDEIGIPKPDPRIFEFAMEQIGEYKKSSIKGIKPTYVITELSELYELLK